MHILLTNDDGPPNAHSSPYIAAFARILSSPPFSHHVSVVVPSQQRSWIGKAHLLPPSLYPLAGAKAPSANEQLSDTIVPTWYDPVAETVSSTPPPPAASPDDHDQAAPASPHPPPYWVLVPGTPATCAQLGVFHYPLLFPSSSSSPPPPIDLVLSGPNHGRNTTAAFALSSGTLGGALEAAICGVRAIALSFAFDRGHPVTPAVLEEACTHSARIVEKLCDGWSVASEGNGQEGVPELFSINVPLREGVAGRPVRWTWMLGNKWRGGSLYKRVGAAAAAEGEKTTAGVAGQSPSAGGAVANATDDGDAAGLAFKWQPTFADIWATIDSSGADNDGLVVKEGETSVTPLRANFAGLHGRAGFEGELKL